MAEGKKRSAEDSGSSEHQHGDPTPVGLLRARTGLSHGLPALTAALGVRRAEGQSEHGEEQGEPQG